MQTLTVLPLVFAYSGFGNLRTRTGYDKPMCNVLLLILSIAATASGNDANQDKSVVHGITISTHGVGRDWGSDTTVPILQAIRDIGANWIAIHPNASINADTSLHWAVIDPQHPSAYIDRPIREAHRLGLSICIKPHITYWRSLFSWRGEIERDLLTGPVRV